MKSDIKRLESQVSTLKEVAVRYSGKTIDNIIIQLESRIKALK